MVTVDFAELIPHSLLAMLGPEFQRTVLDDLATAAHAKWIHLAQRELHSSKADYIAGIQSVENTGRAKRSQGETSWSGSAGTEERTITLLGWLANAVEHGMSSYDMRETLLRGDGVKTSEEGYKYRAIPFRHGTPGTQGGPGAAMGSRMGPQGAQSLAWAASGIMSKGQAAALGRGIYRRAQALGSGERLGTHKGTGFVPVSMGKRRTNVALVPKLAPWHKTDIYAGMKKTTKQYAAATQSQYTTFRMISEKNTQGWIHPGIQARNLAPRVEEFVREIMPKTVNVAIRAALGKMQ